MVYSYHSFLFPFIWENEEIDFLSVFSENNNNNIWICTDGKVRNNSLRSATLEQLNENPIEFDQYQYFNSLSRNLIFSDQDSALVHNFAFKPEYLEELNYIISVKDMRYVLPVSNIVLKIFNTGIAIIAINCSNDQYFSAEAVKSINEYGRRIAMPYWKCDPADSFKCADFLEISGKRISVKDDFRSFRNNQVSLSYISTMIRELLNRNGKKITFRAKYTGKKDEIRIRPVLDEKMFVACLLCDRELVSGYQQDYLRKKGEFSEENSVSLTELINIDIQGKCSISDQFERKKYLQEHLYTAEFGGEYPKLLAISEKAYIKLVAGGDYDIPYFYNIYCQIIIIALVQRMSIAEFQQKIVPLSNIGNRKNKKMTNKEIDRIMSLQEKYVAFQNYYMFREVTSKREGRFVYGRIQEMLKIPSENETLNSQLSRLYELVNTSQSYAFNKWGLIISLIAIEFNVFAFIQTGKSLSQMLENGRNGAGVIAAFVIIAGLIVWGVSSFIFKRKK